MKHWNSLIYTAFIFFCSVVSQIMFLGFYFISIEQNKCYSSWQALKPFAWCTVGISKENYLRSIELELCVSCGPLGDVTSNGQFVCQLPGVRSVALLASLQAHSPVFFGEYVFIRYLRLAVLILGKTMPVWVEHILASNIEIKSDLSEYLLGFLNRAPPKTQVNPLAAQIHTENYCK